jgi:hypothetical protein
LTIFWVLPPPSAPSVAWAKTKPRTSYRPTR